MGPADTPWCIAGEWSDQNAGCVPYNIDISMDFCRLKRTSPCTVSGARRIELAEAKTLSRRLAKASPLLSEENERELVMKSSRNIFGLVGASLLLAVSAMAAGTNKGTLHLYDNVSVQGKQLTPGNYRVEWNGEGPEIQVNIVDGKNTVATVAARVVPVTTKNDQDGYSADNRDGNNRLKAIFFHGKNYELQIESGSGTRTSESGGPTQ